MSKGLRALNKAVDRLLSYTPARKGGKPKKHAAKKSRAKVQEDKYG